MGTGTIEARAGRLAERIRRADARAETVDELFARVSELVGQVVPFDGSMWFGVDPATLMASAPARLHNVDGALCWPFWHNEFHEQDAVLFADLARDPVPVSSLRLATGGRPVRSARFRDFLQPQGYDDEARVAFRTGSTTWAVAALYRETGRASFDPAELAVLEELSPVLGAVLRRRTVGAGTTTPTPEAPGVLLFDAEARLVSANDDALAWADRLFGAWTGLGTWQDALAVSLPTGPLMRYPLVQPLVARAQAVASGYDTGPVRLRLRDAGGRWVVLHASCLGAAPDAPVAVVVEPAKSAEVAPIVVEAYGLSPRERQVVHALARGLGTPEIAAELFLSTHTVRDHLKSVFEKIGVGSRGELVAKLFADHYADPLHERGVHLG